MAIEPLAMTVHYTLRVKSCSFNQSFILCNVAVIERGKQKIYMFHVREATWACMYLNSQSSCYKTWTRLKFFARGPCIFCLSTLCQHMTEGDCIFHALLNWAWSFWSKILYSLFLENTLEFPVDERDNLWSYKLVRQISLQKQAWCYLKNLAHFYCFLKNCNSEACVFVSANYYKGIPG